MIVIQGYSEEVPERQEKKEKEVKKGRKSKEIDNSEVRAWLIKHKVIDYQSLLRVHYPFDDIFVGCSRLDGSKSGGNDRRPISTDLLLSIILLSDAIGDDAILGVYKSRGKEISTRWVRHIKSIAITLSWALQREIEHIGGFEEGEDWLELEEISDRIFDRLGL